MVRREPPYRWVIQILETESGATSFRIHSTTSARFLEDTAERELASHNYFSIKIIPAIGM